MKLENEFLVSTNVCFRCALPTAGAILGGQKTARVLSKVKYTIKKQGPREHKEQREHAKSYRPSESYRHCRHTWHNQRRSITERHASLYSRSTEHSYTSPHAEGTVSYDENTQSK